MEKTIETETDKWHADKAEHGMEQADWTLSLDRLARLLRLREQHEMSRKRDERIAYVARLSGTPELPEGFRGTGVTSAPPVGPFVPLFRCGVGMEGRMSEPKPAGTVKQGRRPMFKPFEPTPRTDGDDHTGCDNEALRRINAELRRELAEANRQIEQAMVKMGELASKLSITESEIYLFSQSGEYIRQAHEANEQLGTQLNDAMTAGEALADALRDCGRMIPAHDGARAALAQWEALKRD